MGCSKAYSPCRVCRHAPWRLHGPLRLATGLTGPSCPIIPGIGILVEPKTCDIKVRRIVDLRVKGLAELLPGELVGVEADGIPAA